MNNRKIVGVIMFSLPFLAVIIISSKSVLLNILIHIGVFSVVIGCFILGVNLMEDKPK